MIAKIDRIFNHPAEKTAFYHKGTAISQKRFAELVKHYSRKISLLPEKDVVLHCDNMFCFFVVFFALLYGGKTLILPSYYYSGLSDELNSALLTDRQGTTGLLADIDVQCELCEEPLPLLSGNAKIVFYTSGSTGTPKKITKRLGNLMDETAYLDRKSVV